MSDLIAESTIQSDSTVEKSDERFVSRVADILFNISGVTQIRWFGSRARGEGTIRSDFDIVVLIDSALVQRNGPHDLNHFIYLCEHTLRESDFPVGHGPYEVHVHCEGDRFLSMDPTQLGGYIKIFLSGKVIRTKPGMPVHQDMSTLAPDSAFSKMRAKRNIQG